MTDIDDERIYEGLTRAEFEAEAIRESALVAASSDEEEIMRWLEAVIILDDWPPYEE